MPKDKNIRHWYAVRCEALKYERERLLAKGARPGGERIAKLNRLIARYEREAGQLSLFD